MGVKVFCDRCDRLIKVIPKKRLNSLSETDFVCIKCAESEQKNEVKLQKIKTVASTKIVAESKAAQTRINEIIKETQQALQELLSQQVSNNGATTRDVGGSTADIPE